MMKFFLSLVAVISIFAPRAHAQASDQTTLRVVGSPKATFAHSHVGQPHLSGVEVEVRNVGKVPAESIQVVATLTTGQRVVLEGPESLAPNSKMLYTKSLWVLNPPKGRVLAEARCGNCRK